MTNHKLTEDGVLTQEALLAYAEGRLSDAERGEMDRLLHDDPFAQDALEGLRGVKHPGEIHTVISSINTQLREKTGLRERRKKGIELHWAIYAYATVVIAVLIGLGFVMVHIFSGGPRDEAGHKLKAQESIPVMEPKKVAALPDTTKSAAPTDSTGSKPQETTPANQNGNATLTDAKPTSLPQTAATSPAPVSATPSPQPQAVGPEMAARLAAAKTLFDASDYVNAAKKYNDILASQPDNPDAMYFGGVCYFINGTGDLGESNFDKLIKTGAFADGAKWYKAVILIRKGKKDDAKALLKNLCSYDNYFKDRALKQYQDLGGK